MRELNLITACSEFVSFLHSIQISIYKFYPYDFFQQEGGFILNFIANVLEEVHEST